MTSGPLIVQSDETALLEVDHPAAADARHELSVFAELERAPEHIHTYRITKLGLWNARAAGHDSDFVLNTLDKYAKFPVPSSVRNDIVETMGRYGKLEIRRDGEDLLLHSENRPVLLEVIRQKKVNELLIEVRDEQNYRIQPWARGQIKQELLKLGWPAEDLAGFTAGTPHPIELSENGWSMRVYQSAAIEKFWDGG